MKDIYNNQEIYHQLTPEEAIFCLDMIQEYENEGIQITNLEKRQMIMNLQVCSF